MGLSLQWNFGRKMQRWPLAFIFCSRRESWNQKSSCLLRRWAIQQVLFSNRQTGAHFACILYTSKPHSLRVCSMPFASPVSVVIFWGNPWNWGYRLFIGITVSFCFHCFPPLVLFMSNARRASGPSDAWADNWSNMKRATYPGCASSNIVIAVST